LLCDIWLNSFAYSSDLKFSLSHLCFFCS
jgi:hypothetical protein